MITMRSRTLKQQKSVGGSDISDCWIRNVAVIFELKAKEEISVYYFHTICGCMQLSRENQSEAGSLKLN